jgi:uncharacterized surface anchored protein
MKKRKIYSFLLAVVLIVSMLPMSVFAASNAGTGIAVTSNPNHWIRRTNHHGYDYTYKPPLINGKWGYCVDFGFSYNSEDASFRNSYSWTHATGAEAEELLNRALLISGMDHFSNEVTANAKWLMSYINQHYTLADNELGEWMMCVQTYLWDNMERKAYGDTADVGSNVDDGGYAYPETYERYKRMYTDLLSLKAAEDVDLQNQVADFAAQGIDAYIAVKPDSQWAVYATSSISGRQGFFNYCEERIVINGERPELPDNPPSGEDGVVTITKRDSRTNEPLAGATYRIEGIDQAYDNSVTTGRSGVAVVEGLFSGSYKIYEENPPEGYLPSNEVQTIHYDGEREINVTFFNDPLVTIEVQKQDADTGDALSAVFDVFKDTEHIDTIRVDGSYTLSGLSEGTYTFVEAACPGNYILDPTPHSIHVDPSGNHTVSYDLIITNTKKPGLEIFKYDRVSKRPLPDVTFAVYKDAELYGQFTTGQDGRIYLDNLHPGTYLVQEIATDDAHIVNSTPQQIEIKAGDTVKTLVFFNDLKPGIHLVKVDRADLSKPIANAKFKIEAVDGSWGPEELTTLADGTIDLSKLPAGAYVVTELACPGYVIDEAQRIIELKPNETAQFVFTNSKLPSLLLKKESSDSSPLAGVSFRLAKIEDGSFYLDRTSNAKGEILWEGLEPGGYSLRELSTVSDHILDIREYHIELFPGKVSTKVIQNQRRPNLIVYKHDADTGEPVEGTVFTVKAADGHSVDEIKTGPDGKAELKNLLPGVYEVSEKSVPAPWLLDAPSQLVTLYPNRDHTVYFKNHKKPNLTVNKIDSVTGNPIKGAKFQVTYASNNTDSGEINDLGIFYSNESGQFTIDAIRDGWYKIRELEPAHGYAIKDPAVQEVYIKGGESKTVVFENTPLSALVVWKYDSVSGEALEGAVFEVKYLGGTSGTGGTVIGTYKTSANGSFTVTGLEAGTYVVQEVSSGSGHVIDSAPQTAFISGREQDVVQLYFGNSPKGALLVKKVDASNGKPLSDVEFLVTDSTGAVVGDANGRFVTDSSGAFTVSGITPNTTLVVKETRAKAGYLLDDAPQTAVIKAGQTVTLEFRNKPLGGLIIHKLDSVTKKPLAGVQFKITYVDGRVVDAEGGKLSSNGLYTTNAEGQIVLSGITGTIVVTEVESIPGYAIDEATRSQTVVVNPDDVQTLTFYNTPVGGVEIVKVSASNKAKRIPNTTFEVRRVDDALVDTVTTGQSGSVHLDLPSGSYYAVEVEAAKGFKLDDTPHYFEVVDGKTTIVTVTNVESSGILIHKIDSTTGKGIYGVEFLLYDSGKNPIGQYASDDRGYVRIEDLTPGRYYLRELENEGYVEDTQLKTVYVKAGETTEVTWKNTPITGQIQIVKKSADYNPTNGLPAGTLLSGGSFDIYNERTGKKVDTIVSGSNGLAVSKPLPLGRYLIRETKAPANYGTSTETYTAVLEYAGQIVRMEISNKSLSTGVSISKTGPKEAIAGQPVNYVLSGIANTSNVMLQSFYWRDALPAQVRLNTIVTGTYNFPGVYKITYRVNGGKYRTLADNLSTQKNYALQASPAALGLAANERVTEIMFVFGQVPGGFSQVEAPVLHCKAVPGLVAGSSFVNIADVGGTHNGVWVQAVSRWVTTVYGKPAPLPRTGY